MATLFDPPGAVVKETLGGRARGDLREDADGDAILDLIGPLIHYRVLFGHASTTDAEIERVVDALLRGIATDDAALLEHSRRTSADAAGHPLHAAAGHGLLAERSCVRRSAPVRRRVGGQVELARAWRVCGSSKWDRTGGRSAQWSRCPLRQRAPRR